MNKQNEPFDESSFDDDQHQELGGPNKLLGQDKTETWLRQFEPRRPKIDFAVIEREVMDTRASVPLTAAVLLSASKRPAAHMVGPLAVSWICGVAVGALFVFYSMQVASERTAINKPVEGSQPKLSEPIKDVDDVEKAQLATAEQSDVSDRFEVDSKLRLGGRFVKASDWMEPRHWNQSGSETMANSADSNSIASGLKSVAGSIFSEYSPPAPTTQAELMRELLRDSNPFVH